MPDGVLVDIKKHFNNYMVVNMHEANPLQIPGSRSQLSPRLLLQNLLDQGDCIICTAK